MNPVSVGDDLVAYLSNPPDGGNRYWGSDYSRAMARKAAARIAELESALRPFARAAQSYDPDEDDGDMDAWDYHPTIGELRFARAALTPEPS